MSRICCCCGRPLPDEPVDHRCKPTVEAVEERIRAVEFAHEGLQGGFSLEQFGIPAHLHSAHVELKRQCDAEAAELAERERQASIRRESERLERELAVTVQP